MLNADYKSYNIGFRIANPEELVRKRFNIAKNNVSYASKIIADTLEAGLIKASDPENASRKFASYVPFWT